MSLIVSREEARSELRVSMPTIDRLVASGELEVVRLGRRVFITRESLVRWVAAHAMQKLRRHDERDTQTTST